MPRKASRSRSPSRSGALLTTAIPLRREPANDDARRLVERRLVEPGDDGEPPRGLLSMLSVRVLEDDEEF